MTKRVRLRREKLGEASKRLGKFFGVDMQEVLKLSKTYRLDSSDCYTFEELSDVAHGQCVDKKMESHLDKCERCRSTVVRVKEYR